MEGSFEISAIDLSIVAQLSAITTFDRLGLHAVHYLPHPVSHIWMPIIGEMRVKKEMLINSIVRVSTIGCAL